MSRNWTNCCKYTTVGVEHRIPFLSSNISGVSGLISMNTMMLLFLHVLSLNIVSFAFRTNLPRVLVCKNCRYWSEVIITHLFCCRIMRVFYYLFSKHFKTYYLWGQCWHLLWTIYMKIFDIEDDILLLLLMFLYCNYSYFLCIICT